MPKQVTFPEFNDTLLTKSAKSDMVPLSQVQTMVQHELNKQSMMRTDSWTNVLVGLGGRSDKSKYTEHSGVEIITDDVLAGVYMNEGLGGRIVDVVADDMTREWITFDKTNEATIETLEDVFTELDAEEKFNEAIRWQRLYGGSLLLIGAMDGGKPDQPLNENKIKSIEYLRVVDRTDVDIGASTFDTDPLSTTFGQVKIYKINTYINGQYVPVNVHSSRVIVFKNDPIPSRIRLSSDLGVRHFGMSSLQRVYESVRDLGGVNQSVVSMLYEFIIGKFKVSHLAEIMSQPGGEAGIIRRMEIMNMSKSMLNAVLVDSEEDYVRDSANLAGLPEIIDRFMLMVSGATGIPVTRLFGRSPGGLNATGENDLRNYYDLVEAVQRNKLKAPLTRLLKLICSWKGIKKVPTIVFNSLYQMTETEISENEQRKAATKQTEANTQLTYVNMGALDADEVRHDILGRPGSVKPEEEPVDDPEGFDPGGDPRKQPKEKDPNEKAPEKAPKNPEPKSQKPPKVKERVR